MDVIESNRMPNEKTKDKTTLTNEELIARVHLIVHSLAETGGKSWTLSVPVNFNKDPDMLIIECTKRMQSQTSLIAELQKWDDLNTAKIAEQAGEIERLKEALREIAKEPNNLNHDLVTSYRIMEDLATNALK